MVVSRRFRSYSVLEFATFHGLMEVRLLARMQSLSMCIQLPTGTFPGGDINTYKVQQTTVSV